MPASSTTTRFVSSGGTGISSSVRALSLKLLRAPEGVGWPPDNFVNLDAGAKRLSADTCPMPIPIVRPLVCASLLLVAVTARAQLATVSPFLPPVGKGSAAPTADAPLEFRGVAELPDGPAFRVVDPSKKRGSWVRLNERDADLGVIVKQHDPVHDTVTVEQQGRTFTLALHQSKVASSGAAMANAVVMPPQMQVPTIASMAQQPPAPPLQQSQIDAVAAAVAQRRALRDQAAQQINRGVPVAPQVIQQQQEQRAQGAANQAGQNANNPNRQNGQNGQNNQRRNRQP